MDDEAKHDLKWVVIWLDATVVFALLGAIGRNAVWMGGLITGTFLSFYGVASFNAWRDRVAEAKGGDDGDT
jgi:hypothetical protein